VHKGDSIFTYNKNNNNNNNNNNSGGGGGDDDDDDNLFLPDDGRTQLKKHFIQKGNK
jgi:hypothetical protein